MLKCLETIVRASKEIGLASILGLSLVFVGCNAPVPKNVRIVYTHKSNDKTPQIYSIDTNSEIVTPKHLLKDFSSNEIYLQCSPNGKNIAFVSRGPKNNGLFFMSSDGSQLRKIDSTKYLDQHLSISGDSKKIAFLGHEDLRNDEIYVIDLEGSKKRITYTSKSITDFEISPDGNKVVYTIKDGYYDIYIVDSDGSNPVQLTSKQCNFKPVFSPNSKYIAFESESRENQRYDICVMNQDGTLRRSLTNDPLGRNHAPCWSPDGKKLAYDTQYREIDYIYQGEHWLDLSSIAVINLDGTGEKILTSTEFLCTNPHWSPDGKTIAFIVSRGPTQGPEGYKPPIIPKKHFGIINCDGSNPGECVKILTPEIETYYISPSFLMD